MGVFLTKNFPYNNTFEETKVKIQILSDLHLERKEAELPLIISNVDAIILAGDIFVYNHSLSVKNFYHS